MKVKITPSPLQGTVQAIGSKSYAHRALICAALAKDGASTIIMHGLSADIRATMRCLTALGAKISKVAEDTYLVTPIERMNYQSQGAPLILDCGESGSTLRFLVPVCAALGIQAQFVGQGRLMERPMEEMQKQLQEHGIAYEAGRIRGQELQGGTFLVDASQSSQFVSGLLLALPLLDEEEGENVIRLLGDAVSAPYIGMTIEVMKAFGVSVTTEDGYRTQGTYHACNYTVEGDWSNGAFFLAAGCEVQGLNPNSRQGDSIVTQLFHAIRTLDGVSLDCADTPDLVPILAVYAAMNEAACRIGGIGQLAYKESNRLESIEQLLEHLGIEAIRDKRGFLIFPSQIQGGEVDSFGDHRIAMAAAIAATTAKAPVIIRGAQAVDKSYPRFWQDYEALGGKVEYFDE